MAYADQTYNLRIELDTEHCQLRPDEISHLERALAPLREPVKNFPVANLYVTIQYNAPSQDYRVKTVLQLPGRALATGDVEEQYYPAFRRCIRKLVHKLTAYKNDLSNSAAIAKHERGTRHQIIAEHMVEPDKIEAAAQAEDYGEFRRQLDAFEEPLRKRIGRWVQRYPAIEEQLGERFELADMVEEVFLNAFERYTHRPHEVPFGDWLESLIDPSIKLLNAHPSEELENIRFARTAAELDGSSQK